MAGKAPRLTQEVLRGLLTYDPETGIFIWKARSASPRWTGRYAGRRAGYEWTATGGGRYRSIRIFDWPFPEHRLASIYMGGPIPDGIEIDHRNLDGTDNRWENLRPATKRQNGANRTHSRRNKLGFKGVTVDARNGRYRATIGVSGKQHWLGYFDTPQEAHAAYQRAAEAHFGEFGRAS